MFLRVVEDGRGGADGRSEARGIDGDAVPRAEARVALALERRTGIDQREVDVEEDRG